MKNSILLLSFAILALSCSKKDVAPTAYQNSAQQSSIINGTPVAADNVLAKSVVGLLFNYPMMDGLVWVQGCTGSVLGDRYILTAAHCIAHFRAEDLAVNFSLNTILNSDQMDSTKRITDIESKFVTRKVKAMKAHPFWAGSGNHDLAILLLDQPVPEGSVPVTLLPEQFINLAEEKTTLEGQNLSVILMGFGLISEDPSTDTDVLRETVTPAHFEGLFVVTDQTQGTGGCNGDSGGPAFLKHEGKIYQVGVTHGPHGNSTTCHEQGEWMNPALDLKFIEDTKAELAAQASNPQEQQAQEPQTPQVQ